MGSRHDLSKSRGSRGERPVATHRRRRPRLAIRGGRGRARYESASSFRLQGVRHDRVSARRVRGPVVRADAARRAAAPGRSARARRLRQLPVTQQAERVGAPARISTTGSPTATSATRSARRSSTRASADHGPAGHVASMAVLRGRPGSRGRPDERMRMGCQRIASCVERGCDIGSGAWQRSCNRIAHRPALG